MSLVRKIIFNIIIVNMIFNLIKTAEADQFITKSNILKKANIKIYVGENQKESIVFHNEDIANIALNESYVLNSQGALSLQGKLEKIDLLNVCGDPIPGIGFKKDTHDGFLMVTGHDIDKYIKFYPAYNSEQSKINDCLNVAHEQEKTMASSVASNGLDGFIQQMRWKRKLTKSDIEKQCDEFARWNVHLDKQNKYKNLYEDCMHDGSHCDEEERVVITLQNESGKCIEITNSAIYCDGEVGIGIDLQEFLGVLRIEHNSEKEVWLLWNAPGYEGDGIYTIELNDIKNKNRTLEEWLVYNGC